MYLHTCNMYMCVYVYTYKNVEVEKERECVSESFSDLISQDNARCMTLGSYIGAAADSTAPKHKNPQSYHRITQSLGKGLALALPGSAGQTLGPRLSDVCSLQLLANFGKPERLDGIRNPWSTGSLKRSLGLLFIWRTRMPACRSVHWQALAQGLPILPMLAIGSGWVFTNAHACAWWPQA